MPSAAFEPTVRLCDRLIGAAGAPPYVIAEIGVNHNGDVELARQLVREAARAGADAVKFQVFRADELACASAKSATYQASATGEANQREMLKKLELTRDEFASLHGTCRDEGVAFLATPFGLSDVDLVVGLGAPAIKIASTDLTNRPLLERVIDCGRPVILSTGTSTLDEIGEALGWFAARGASDRVVLLHCISRYPVPADELNLRAIGVLRERFGVVVGFSDHSEGVAAGAWAVCAGARVLEKHVTVDRSLAGPDHAMSITPAELAAYVAGAHEAARAMGMGRLDDRSGEEEVRRVARKSIVAAVEIRLGEVITADMLSIKRPGDGIPPRDLQAVVGRTAAEDIPADVVLLREMIR